MTTTGLRQLVSSALVAATIGALAVPPRVEGVATTAREPAFGLPHIFADLDLELARENGREIAKDRLGQLLLLARVGRGTLYQAFGLLDPSTLADDIAARQTAYTSSELNNMYAKLPQRERDIIMEYCKGVNDTIDAVYAGSLPEPIEVDLLRNFLLLPDDLFGNKNNISDQVDPNYAAAGGAWPNAGFQFTPEMVVAIIILEIRNFGINDFGEASRLTELQALIAKHGTLAGTEIWDDLNFLNDPLAGVTVPDPTTPGYGGPLARAVTPPVMLASAAQRFPRYDYAAGVRALEEAATHRADTATRLGAWPMLGSYAWVIAGDKSASGNPWLGGFPQTGIQTPSIMHFAENRSAEGPDHRINGIGMEFAGAPFVLIGQTDTVGYTSTTAQLRIIDTFFERIVNENTDALRYNDMGTSAPLEQRTELFDGNFIADATRVFWRSHERAGNGGSRAVVDFVGDREGTADSGTATTLVDAGAFDASFVGGHVAIVDGAGAGQIRAISAVPDADTLTVGSAWTTMPTNTSVYVAVKAGNTVMAAALDSPTWLEETTGALGFLLMQRAEDILDIRAAARIMTSTHNFPAIDNQAFNGIGTMNGNGNIGYWSSGFSRKRQGGLDPRLPLDGSAASNPLALLSGTVASATATTLMATGSIFTSDLSPEALNFRYANPTQQGSDYIVAITSGTGYKQTRRIASNSGDTLTLELAWGVTPVAGDTFDVAEIPAMPEAINPSEGYMANWNNKAATADEGENFGRQFRHIFILERLAAENAWDRNKQRQLNKDVAGLDGKGDFGRFLIPRLRDAVDAVGNGGNPAVDTVLAALEAHIAAPFLGRNFINPVTDTMNEGEVSFLNQLVNRLALDIYGDEYDDAVSVPTGGRALNIVQHAIDSKAGDVTGSYGQAFGGDYFVTSDHFMCYKVKKTPDTPKFTAQTVTLTDAFETGGFDVKKPKLLCPPANKNNEGLRDPVTHLESYLIKAAADHVPQTNLVVKDQFGTLSVNTIKASHLLVPTGKALGGPATLPTSDLDNFKCYKIKVTPGTPKFTAVQATFLDQFENRLYDVKKPKRLCLPVNVDGGGINDSSAALLCYKVKPADAQPDHTPVEGQINTANDFGTGQLDTIKESEACIPASVNPGTTQGWEVTVRNSLSALATVGIPADSTRSNSTYSHPLASLFPSLVFEPTLSGNRGTYEQIVEAGATVNGEFMFPLGQSGLIEGSFAGVTSIDPNFDSLQPIWRDWRFVPMLHVAADLAGGGTGDSDTDGILDGYERWYYGNLTENAASDTDADGLALLGEFTAGSDPTDSDTDDDAILDGADGTPQDRLMP